MYVRPFRNRGVDLFQKVEELGRPVALVAFADHRASRDVERGKQRCRSMADVGMGSPLGDARRHRQHRLFPVQCLNLGFFVHAQHDGPARRRHVEADDVLHLVDEQRIGGQLEGFTPMWLQAKGSPDPADGGVRQPRLGGH